MVVKHIHRVSLKKQIHDLEQEIKMRRVELSNLRQTLRQHNKDSLTEKQRKVVTKLVTIARERRVSRK